MKKSRHLEKEFAVEMVAPKIAYAIAPTLQRQCSHPASATVRTFARTPG